MSRELEALLLPTFSRGNRGTKSKSGDIIPISAIPWFTGYLKVADAMLDQGIV